MQRNLFASTSSIEFNNLMMAASVIGCAYGYDKTVGYPAPIANLSIIGENADRLAAASEILRDWGCDEDGDAVGLEIVLRRDGTYLLGMGPDQRRLVNRMSKDQDLFDLLFMGTTWIKKMDTTNPLLLEWKELFANKLMPVQISFATANTLHGIPQRHTLRDVPGALRFIKFETKITTEEEAPDHMFIEVVDRRKGRSTGPKDAKGSDIAVRRQRVINSAFPISRERIRRHRLYEKIVDLLGDEEISIGQVTQAAINLELSREWSGQDHYPNAEDVGDKWWERVSQRVELTSLPNAFEEMEIPAIARQLELDVEAVIRRHGATLFPKFKLNQRQFIRLGYGGK
ncbi:hypothetical protein OIU34_00120 [Pararhizobium sp. BT-229]|uniref:hypothetical protein n=1 Tax=Pararhizobium sp. BT-229 TaxID=2986923 RepID=UPI0021F7FDB6|nr:hypothetical protein [Pararhizobium sp. BT-229]MCV9960293.1 hypothetical protein [Pararhizobium sp. BT-229]